MQLVLQYCCTGPDSCHRELPALGVHRQQFTTAVSVTVRNLQQSTDCCYHHHHHHTVIKTNAMNVWTRMTQILSKIFPILSSIRTDVILMCKARRAKYRLILSDVKEM